MKARFRKPFILLFLALAATIAILALRGDLGSLVGRPSGATDDVRSGADRPGSGYVVSGRVVDHEGSPIEGARVTGGDRIASSDGEGFFTLKGLAAGELLVDATADGFVSAGPEGLRELRLTLAGAGAGETRVDGVELVLRRPGQITGRVVAGDTPVAASLSLAYAGAEGLAGPLGPFAVEAIGASDASGAFALTELAPGRLRLVAEADDYAVAESGELYLGDGERLQDITIDLLPSGVLAGVVRDQAGAALSGAEVLATGAALSRPLRTRSDPSGRFRFDALPTGTLEVRARASGYRSAELNGVEVVAAVPRQVELVLQPATGLFGRVLDADGAGVPQAYVVLALRGRWKVLRTDADGGFGWTEAPDQLLDATAVTPQHRASAKQAVRRGEEAILRLGPGGYIEGRVVDSAGAPISRFSIGVESFQVDGLAPYGKLAYRPQDVARSDGRFRFGPLRPGSYHLRARAAGKAPGSAGPIAVSSERSTSGVVIRLSGGATVRGSVSEPGGQPIAGARVTLFDPLNPFETKSISTDREGSYVLRGVPTGRRSLKVTARRYLTEIAAGIEVPDGGEVWRDVTLTRATRGDGFSFHGIGAVLRPRGEGFEIVETIDGRPAAINGLRSGDLIIEVDREPAGDLRLEQVIELIRGEEGVAVELEIERDGEGRFTVEVERGRVVVQER